MTYRSLNVFEPDSAIINAQMHHVSSAHRRTRENKGDARTHSLKVPDLSYFVIDMYLLINAYKFDATVYFLSVM